MAGSPEDDVEGELDLLPTSGLDNVDEADLLKELEELMGSRQQPEQDGTVKVTTAPLSELRAIRMGPIDLGDYNVEHVQLTPEDEHDPELLTELASISLAHFASNKETPHTDGGHGEENDAQGKKRSIDPSLPNEPEPVPEKCMTVKDEIQMLKQLALEAKRAGDMGMARELMLQIRQLTQQETLTKQTDEDDHQLLIIKDVHGSSAPPAPAPPRTKLLQKKLLSQAQVCREVAKAQLAAGYPGTAAEFVRLERKLVADLAKVRDLAPGAPAPITTTVPIEIPLDNTNEEVEEDCLLIKLRPQLKSNTNRGDFQKSTYHIVTILEWPPIREGVRVKDEHPPLHRQQTEKFNLLDGKELCLVYRGIKRELRTAKFFEHHKLKLELFREDESGIGSLANLLLRRPKQTLIGQTAVRMTPLTSVGKLGGERTEFIDTSGRKGTGILVALDMLVRRPLSPKAAFSMKKTVEWTVLSQGNFFGNDGDGQAGKPLSVEIPTSPVAAEEEIEALTKEAEERARGILSYAVLEDELAKARSDPDSATDPRQMAWLMALETALDQMTMAVELGTLTMNEYLERLREQAIPQTKQQALAAKRAGRLDEARRHLQYLRLMEGELAEVEAGNEGEKQGSEE